MKQYEKTHTNKAAHDAHLKKIKANGGIVISDDGHKIVYEFIKTSINKNYTHFAVLKSTGRIVNGWDYKGYDQDELNSEKKHYFYQDLEDIFDANSIDKTGVSIMTKKSLAAKGINPFDEKNWK
jgi:hypothetical protein